MNSDLSLALKYAPVLVFAKDVKSWHYDVQTYMKSSKIKGTDLSYSDLAMYHSFSKLTEDAEKLTLLKVQNINTNDSKTTSPIYAQIFKNANLVLINYVVFFPNVTEEKSLTDNAHFKVIPIVIEYVPNETSVKSISICFMNNINQYIKYDYDLFEKVNTNPVIIVEGLKHELIQSYDRTPSNPSLVRWIPDNTNKVKLIESSTSTAFNPAEHGWFYYRGRFSSSGENSPFFNQYYLTNPEVKLQESSSNGTEQLAYMIMFIVGLVLFVLYTAFILRSHLADSYTNPILIRQVLIYTVLLASALVGGLKYF